jgi:hypothetical protein
MSGAADPFNVSHYSRRNIQGQRWKSAESVSGGTGCSWSCQSRVSITCMCLHQSLYHGRNISLKATSVPSIRLSCPLHCIHLSESYCILLCDRLCSFSSNNVCQGTCHICVGLLDMFGFCMCVNNWWFQVAMKPSYMCMELWTGVLRSENKPGLFVICNG